MQAKRPSSRDVARRAGVSQTAVSFVLTGNDKNNVAPATRERILRAAAELGYQPNRLAQGLRGQQTHVIGLITDAIASSPFAGRLLGGAIEQASTEDYVMVVFDSHDHPEREQVAVAELESRQVDGLIYATMGLVELDRTVRTRLPLVLTNCFERADQHPTVIPDDYAGARSAAQLLLDLGHRRISMLTGQGAPTDRRPSAGNIAGPIRSRGFRSALRAAGVPTGLSPVVVAGWSIDAGYHAARAQLTDRSGRLLRQADRPTAIVAVTDRVATGVLLAATSLGLAVPRDLSIVGFDDQEALASDVVPPLTTVALPHVELGARAVELLVQRLRGQAPVSTHRELLPMPVVRRESTAPPR